MALSKREQKGFVVLSILLISLIIFYFLTPLIFYTRQNRGEVNDMLKDWIDSVNAINSIEVGSKPDSLFYFDPNDVVISKLQKLGVNGYALINWLKYRESGSRFSAPEDILKVYSLDSTLASKLIPYVRFNTKIVKNEKYTQASAVKNSKERVFTRDSSSVREYENKRIVSKDIFVIEINTADTAEFAVLNGIGPVLSSRIVLYRAALGGFFDVEQLKEVYGMPASTIDKNLKYLSVDSLSVKKINVNRVALRQLKSHPYIDFYLAKAIVEYRKENNSIKSVEEVLSFKEVKPQLKNKLAVYLSVE